MGRKSPGRALDPEVEQTQTDELIGGWLEALKGGERGAHRVCGRRQFACAFQRYLSDGDMPAARVGLLSACAAEDLRAAADLLRGCAEGIPQDDVPRRGLRAAAIRFAEGLVQAAGDPPPANGSDLPEMEAGSGACLNSQEAAERACSAPEALPLAGDAPPPAEGSDFAWASSRVLSSPDPESIARTVAEAAAAAASAPRAALFLADEEGALRPLAAGQIGFEEAGSEPLPAVGHLGAEVLAAETPRAIAEATREQRGHDLLVRWMGATSLLCLPMTAPEGLRGLLVVADDAPRTFDPHLTELLAAYATQAALAFQGALLSRRALGQIRRLGKLSEVSEAVALAREPGETADVVLRAAAELLEAPVGLMWFVEPGVSGLVLRATHGLSPEEWAVDRLKPGEGLAGLAAQCASPLVSADVTRDGRFSYRREARQMGLGAAIAAPLISRGRVVGVLNLYRKSTSRFAETDLHLLMSLANTAAAAIENANLWREAQQRSEFVTAMLSEVNHRMRNSLQSVAGLLRMELERPQARSAEEVVRRAVTHVQSVAAVHEVLREQDLQFVDMKEAALRVARISHRGGRERPVDIEVTGARVMLPSQKAISVAQLLNELLDNALRHGLAGQEGGKVFVSLAEVGGEVVLQVRDTGVGAPGGVVPEESPGLGLKIVRGLVEELGGRVECEGRQGFTVRIRFPKLD